MKKPTLIQILIVITIFFQFLFYYLSKEIIYPIFLLSISLLLLFLSQTITIKIPKIFSILFAGLILFNLLSSLQSGYPFQSTIEMIKLIGLFILTILGFTVFQDPKTISRVFFPILSIGTFLTLAGIVEYSGRDRQFVSLGLSEPFHWPSLAAAFILLLIPVATAYYLEKSRSFTRKIFFFFVMYYLIVSSILTKHEILLSIFGVVIVLCIYYFQKLSKYKLNKLLFLEKESIEKILFILILLCVTVPNLLPSFGEQKTNQEVLLFQEKVIFQDPNDIMRFSINSIRNHFWWGIGPGNFGAYYRHDLKMPWTWGDFANNEFLQTFVESGFPSLLFEALLLFYIVIKSVLTIWKYKRHHDLVLLSFAVASSLFVIQSLNNFALRVFPIQLLFFLMVSVIIKSDRSFSVSKKWLTVLLLPPILISLILFYDGLSLRSAQRKFSLVDDPGSEKVFSGLTNRPKYLLNPSAYYWQSTAFLLKENPDQAILSLRKGQKLEPYNQETTYQIAKILYINKQTEEAIKILSDTISNNPYVSPKYYLGLANIYQEQNNLIGANEIFLKAGTIFPISSLKYQKGREILTLNEFSSLRQIYLSLYKLTGNTSYLTAYFQ